MINKPLRLTPMSLLQSMPSTASMFSMYTTFTASAMLVRTVVSEVQHLAGQLMPRGLRDMVLSRVDHLFGNLSSQMTVIVDEYRGISINEIYGASEAYLSTRISPSIRQVKVSRVSQEQNISITANEGEKIIDVYEGIPVMWEFISTPTRTITYEDGYHSTDNSEKRSIRLSFHKKYKDVVLGVYLPHVMERSKAMKEESKVVKLYSYGFHGSYSGNMGPWGSINLDHPSTFDTLAMDPGLKKDLIDDLDRFLKRKDYYRRVGKAWKRGYLLYGPPGTGKSSLIAAMANYLKFDIYDLDLTNIHRNQDLRGILTSTGNCSILVIEDIDCTIELQDRNYGDSDGSDSQLTLSGLLNFIDGLWSSCGDGRIIVFTTNYKDKLDPALLRPGRMDMHIHMSYCDPFGFRILASNYLSLKSHRLFPEIEDLLAEVEVTPAEVAEELMKSEDADIALAGLAGLLRRQKVQRQEEGMENKAMEEEVEGNAGKKRAKKCGKNMGKRRKRVAVGGI